MLRITQNSGLPGTSISDCLMSYTGHSLRVGLALLQRSRRIIQPKPTGQSFAIKLSQINSTKWDFLRWMKVLALILFLLKNRTWVIRKECAPFLSLPHNGFKYTSLIIFDTYVKEDETNWIKVEGDQKAPFSIAATSISRGGRYTFPLIAPLYPWYVPYIAEC